MVSFHYSVVIPSWPDKLSFCAQVLFSQASVFCVDTSGGKDNFLNLPVPWTLWSGLLRGLLKPGGPFWSSAKVGVCRLLAVG